MLISCFTHGHGCARNAERAAIFTDKAQAAGGLDGCGDTSWAKSVEALRALGVTL
jgi:hypothetical protein